MHKGHYKQQTFGIGFDQHHSDSALKLLAPKSYRKYERWTKTSRSVPRQEILVSLLLFGKAYLSRPTRLSGAEFPELDALEREDLIGWIPYEHYRSSYNYLHSLVTKLVEKAIYTNEPEMIPLDFVTGELRIRDFVKHQLEREAVDSEVSHDISIMMERIFYLTPLVYSNLRHLEVQGNAWNYLLFPVAEGIPSWLPSDPIGYQEITNEAEVGMNSFLRWNSIGWDERKVKRDELDRRRFQRDSAAVLDAAASSLAAETFSAVSGLPLKTNGDADQAEKRRTILGPEAYQLMKIQFRDLRYPVIESLGDVLRLRGDPHLGTYRTVIAEYSKRLREELESEKPRVLQAFRKDIQSALRSLKVVKRWSKIVDVSFYVSIPLAIIGVFCGLPLSDIVAIPLTSCAKIVSYEKRKELDWILFGRSDSA